MKFVLIPLQPPPTTGPVTIGTTEPLDSDIPAIICLDLVSSVEEHSGGTTVRLSSGEKFQCRLTVEEFMEMLRMAYEMELMDVLDDVDLPDSVQWVKRR